MTQPTSSVPINAVVPIQAASVPAVASARTSESDGVKKFLRDAFHPDCIVDGMRNDFLYLQNGLNSDFFKNGFGRQGNATDSTGVVILKTVGSNAVQLPKAAFAAMFLIMFTMMKVALRAIAFIPGVIGFGISGLAQNSQGLSFAPSSVRREDPPAIAADSYAALVCPESDPPPGPGYQAQLTHIQMQPTLRNRRLAGRFLSPTPVTIAATATPVSSPMPAATLTATQDLTITANPAPIVAPAPTITPTIASPPAPTITPTIASPPALTAPVTIVSPPAPITPPIIASLPAVTLPVTIASDPTAQNAAPTATASASTPPAAAQPDDPESAPAVASTPTQVLESVREGINRARETIRDQGLLSGAVQILAPPFAESETITPAPEAGRVRRAVDRAWNIFSRLSPIREESSPASANTSDQAATVAIASDAVPPVQTATAQETIGEQGLPSRAELREIADRAWRDSIFSRLSPVREESPPVATPAQVPDDTILPVVTVATPAQISDDTIPPAATVATSSVSAPASAPDVDEEDEDVPVDGQANANPPVANTTSGNGILSRIGGYLFPDVDSSEDDSDDDVDGVEGGSAPASPRAADVDDEEQVDEDAGAQIENPATTPPTATVASASDAVAPVQTATISAPAVASTPTQVIESVRAGINRAQETIRDQGLLSGAVQIFAPPFAESATTTPAQETGRLRGAANRAWSLFSRLSPIREASPPVATPAQVPEETTPPAATVATDDDVDEAEGGSAPASPRAADVDEEEVDGDDETAQTAIVSTPALAQQDNPPVAVSLPAGSTPAVSAAQEQSGIRSLASSAFTRARGAFGSSVSGVGSYLSSWSPFAVNTDDSNYDEF